jgi:hypothetical protein
MTDTDIPTAPPRWTPPVGLGTVSGYSAGVLALVGAVVDAIAGENIDADTRTLLVTGIAAVVFTSGAVGSQQVPTVPPGLRS